MLVPLVPHAALDALPTSARVGRALPTTELVAALAALTRRHRAAGAPPCQGAAFVAHSLGTAYLAALLKAEPRCVAAACFADPICFLLHQRDVLHNFFYARPRLAPAGTFAACFHWLQHRMVSQDPTVQDCLRRQFWWSQFELHPGLLPSRTLVLLSAADTVCRPFAVADDLRRRAPPGVAVRMAQGPLAIHGSLCLSPAAQRAAIAELQQMLAASPQDKGLAPCDEGDTDSVSSSDESGHESWSSEASRAAPHVTLRLTAEVS